MASPTLTESKTRKYDEFFTQYPDIEAELLNYRKHWFGSIVYCNCDGKPSNFSRFFRHHFHALGLRLIYTSCYKSNQPDLFRANYGHALATEYNGNLNEVKHWPLKGNGDFRSPECVELLKKCDIVATNPPFSMFRKFIALMYEYNKKFIVLGNINAITYTEVATRLLSGELWLGVRPFNQTMTFDMTAEYKSLYGDDTVDLRQCCWFTNLTHDKIRKLPELTQCYNPDIHVDYDDGSAINIDELKDLPKNYDGPMGVPITYLDKHNPDDFDLLGIAGDSAYIGYKSRPAINGVCRYRRIIIQRKNKGVD